MREDIEIYKAGISDMDKITDLIVSINEKRRKLQNMMILIFIILKIL